MYITAITVLCVAIGVALVKRPSTCVIVATILWVALPQSASPLGIHPSSIIVIVTMVLRLAILRPGVLSPQTRLVAATAGAAGAWALLEPTFVLSAILRPGVILGVLVAPVCFYVLASQARATDPAGSRKLVRLLLTLSVVEATLAIAQRITGRTILYEDVYSRYVWVLAGHTDRSPGSLDHFLILSLLLCLGMALLANIPRRWLLPVGAILLGGIIATQSRTGLVVGAITLLIVSLRGPGVTLTSRLGTLTVAGAAIAYSFAFGAFSSITARFINDAGSAEARNQSIEWFLAHWQNYFPLGNGLGSSFGVAASAGLVSTSFENPIIMFVVDLGIPAAALFLGAQVKALFRPNGEVIGARLGAIAVLASAATFSSENVQSAVGPLLWLSLALVGEARSLSGPLSKREGRLTGNRSPMGTRPNSPKPVAVRILAD